MLHDWYEDESWKAKICQKWPNIRLVLRHEAARLLGPRSDNGSELMTRANREQLGIYSREGMWHQCDVARTFVKAILGHPSDLQHIGFGFATPAAMPWRHNKTKQSRTQHSIETRGKTQYAFRSWLACFFGVNSSILFSPSVFAFSRAPIFSSCTDSFVLYWKHVGFYRPYSVSVTDVREQ